MNHFHYPRHFLLLTCFSALLVVLTLVHLLIDLSVSFALYGALHASALVLAVRSPMPIRRQCLFVAMAGGLSVVSLHVGIACMHWLGTLPGNIGLHTALGFSAVSGALTYGISIRLFRIFRLASRALALISVGCMLATYIAFVILAHSPSLGRWWLVVLWWYAFSGGLWYCDSRDNTAGAGPERRHV
jgi:hypothetical protein